ncbi:DUF6122 family protein [Marinicella rhabdoformis]|uniref:DUF6122 family protein n=1 Tax=Marinicella rhabdoformis TaxID=2580566 RepID=UPI0015CFF910|nr:DUF6122 family protein [Marinicella rhabdoformis]
MTHILLHFLVPLLVAFWVFRKTLCQAVLVMWLTMLVDLDHLLATPVYDPMRCSMGFHPLHQWWFFVLYVLMVFWKPTRIIGAGLVIHMLLDSLDCDMASLIASLPFG